MTIEDKLKISTSHFPFKVTRCKKNRLMFVQTIQREDSKEGSAMEITHNGHDHLSLVFKSLHKTSSGRQGSKCVFRWSLNSKETVALASILFYMSEELQRDSDEVPYYRIVAKEKESFGPNWINEDHESALERLEKRKSRSHLYGLLRRCIETCTDDDFISYLLIQTAMWADAEGDEFSVQQAEKAFAQLGLIPEGQIN